MNDCEPHRKRTADPNGVRSRHTGHDRRFRECFNPRPRGGATIRPRFRQNPKAVFSICLRSARPAEHATKRH